jgi:superfamily II DNA or RNA helicase
MTREELQNLSLDNWVDNSYQGIIKAVTGLGKLSIFFKSLYILREKVNLQQEEVWFFRETLIGKETLIQECTEFFKREGKNPCEDFNIVFKTYQSKSIGNPFYECLDECDFADIKYLEPIFNRNTQYRMGLTATMSHRKTKLYAPYMEIIFNYTRKEALEHDNVNPLETYVIEHELDKAKPYAKLWKKSVKDSSEYDFYKGKIDYTNWDAANPSIVMFVRKIQLPKMLFNLPSKIDKFNEVKGQIKGKCIVFAKEHSFLSQLGIPHLNGKNDKEIIEKFNAGQIQFMGATSKKIGRGVNLKEVENIFLMSSGKSFTDFSQVIGRSRKQEGLVTKLWIIVTKGTYEENWINEVNKEKDGFRVIESFNLNKR